MCVQRPSRYFYLPEVNRGEITQEEKGVLSGRGVLPFYQG